MSDDITVSVVCDECGEETFAYEKFCHKCGANRWDL